MPFCISARPECRSPRSRLWNRTRLGGISIPRLVSSKSHGRFTTRLLFRIDRPMAADRNHGNTGATGPLRLEMRHISKSFGGVRALRDAPFSAEAGEVVAL